MGKKQMKHINELRIKALAGDKMAAQALMAATYVPPHLRTPDPLGAMHRRIGTTFKKGVHVTAKTLKAVTCQVAESISPDYGLDRLQMLVDRRARRAERLAA